MKRPCLHATLVATLLLAGSAAAEPPFVLVDDGVTDFHLSEPKVFWHTASGCTPTPDHGPPLNADQPELIHRTASARSNVRKLLDIDPPRAQDVCNPYLVLSRIVSDAEHVYWVDTTGLVRLPVEANPGDAPELVTSEVRGQPNGFLVEIGIDAQNVYAITPNTGSSSTSSKVWIVSKASSSASLIADLTSMGRRPSSDGEFLYWLAGGHLRRYRLDGRPGPAASIASGGVAAYYAEGHRMLLGGSATEYVFYARGNSIWRYNNIDSSTTGPIYSSDVADAFVYDLRSISQRSIVAAGTSTHTGLYFFEARPYTCPDCLFPVFPQHLYRTSRNGGDADLLYLKQSQNPTGTDADYLTTNGSFLFWQDGDRILRLAANADALELTNMRVTGLEVTQGIQDLNHSVRLISGRRTFVRVYVRSDDPDASVSGVRCELSGSWSGGSGGPLGPVNPSSSLITVYPSPDRKVLDHSFLFELPWSWTEEASLVLTASLNPGKSPPQASYANNIRQAGPFAFEPSPRFEVQFVAFKYEFGGTEYSPSYDVDILPTFSWMRRVYPLASQQGGFDDSGPGLRTRLWYLFDEDLGAKVNRTADDCLELDEDDRSLCAVNYTNSRLKAWRAEYGDVSRHYYGLLSDGLKFPRGRSGGGGSLVASGPTGDSCCGSSWDTDGTYADWYSGHEIGHTLGRAHPSPASDDPDTEATEGCGHSDSDQSYPYAGAFIGPSGGSLMGFDGGDISNPKAVLPRDTWTDVMGYCSFQWISDYTYNALFDRITAEQASLGDGAGAGRAVPGYFLGVFGAVLTQRDGAVIHHLRCMPRTVDPYDGRRGSHALELLDSLGAALDSHPFLPRADDDTGLSRSFDLVVPFVDGTRQVRIVRLADGVVLTTRTISGSPPSVSSVHLASPPSPVSGVVTLAWTASDADGDSLCFDVLYSRDSGASFGPLCFNVKTTTLAVSSAELGGGSGRFRVVATDGVHCAEGDSPAYNVAGKRPVPRILLPIDGLTIPYGQLVNFSGMADDLQDGLVARSGLSWTVPGRRPITGPAASSDSLPVGANVIRLTARNSLGLSASTEITVIVHDDLAAPGPILTAGPTALGWHVAAGSTTSRSGAVIVSNTGGASLNWTAATSAAWITLSPTSGEAPAVLTVTASPAGLGNGDSRSAEVVISQVGGAQSVVVQVSLSAGDPFHEGAIGGGAAFRRGDSNGDARADISDAINTLGYLFGGVHRMTCLDAADFNDDANVDITDAIAELGWLFFSGPAPPAPGTACGADPSADVLAACVYQGGC